MLRHHRGRVGVVMLNADQRHPQSLPRSASPRAVLRYIGCRSWAIHCGRTANSRTCHRSPCGSTRRPSRASDRPGDGSGSRAGRRTTATVFFNSPPTHRPIAAIDRQRGSAAAHIRAPGGSAADRRRPGRSGPNHPPAARSGRSCQRIASQIPPSRLDGLRVVDDQRLIADDWRWSSPGEVLGAEC